MRKKYILLNIFLTLLFFASQQVFSQKSDNNENSNQKIDNLSVYPNPINSNNSTLHITTKLNASKSIKIYNVLGKQIFQTQLLGKELNISMLSPGVYLIKVEENNISETRKLIIR